MLPHPWYAQQLTLACTSQSTDKKPAKAATAKAATAKAAAASAKAAPAKVAKPTAAPSTSAPPKAEHQPKKAAPGAYK